ncbi:TetR/AcrR family transcriptional regulator [Luteimicrobium album]|uniref:TetR/AcrR family transcriptional regulator n=1 Tax=Luteimicrobium album TaxID=1054550 RepID=UPI0024E0A576|nr:TetR/AcrR family transcriptional regulator [Luteimicrobium album]
MPTPDSRVPTTPAQVRLMEACERVVARRGLGGTTIAEVTREADHRNHAAVRYHFGSLEALVRAMYGWRAAPLDAARRHGLERLDEAGRGHDVHALLALFVTTARENLQRLRPSAWARVQVALAADGPYVFFRRIDDDRAASGASRLPLDASREIFGRLADGARANGVAEPTLATATAVRSINQVFACWETDDENPDATAPPLDALTDQALRIGGAILDPGPVACSSQP